MGSQMKLWTLGDKMGVLEAIGLEVPNFPKRVSWWGSTTNHFLMGSQMKLWPLAYKMGVLEAIRWDVPNLIKDVPNFVKDVPRVPKCFPRWGSSPDHFLKGS